MPADRQRQQGRQAALIMRTGDRVIARRLGELAQAFALNSVEATGPAGAPGPGADNAGPDPALPQGRPSVLVIDLGLPEALDWLAFWRAQWPDAIIAGFLAAPDRDRWVAAQRAGCDLVANRGALIPRLRDRLRQSGNQGDRSFPLFADADVAGRLGLVFRTADTPVGPVAVYRLAGGLHAIADQCPHAGVALSGGEVDAAVVTCPGHGSRFDIRSGERLRGPADSDIAVFPLVRQGGQVCLLIR